MRKRIQTQDVVVMYTEQHLTMEQIGKLYGVTRQAIYKHLKKAGVKARESEIVNVQCVMCGQETTKHRSRMRKSRKRYCSPECYYLSRSNPRFISSRQGTRLARVIVSQYFKLLPEHIVHHEDGNERNNKIENLKVFANQSDHLKYHHGINKIKPLWDGSILSSE